MLLYLVLRTAVHGMYRDHTSIGLVRFWFVLCVLCENRSVFDLSIYLLVDLTAYLGAG